jgi:hypothetical protein
MDGFTGLCVENLPARPFFRLGGRAYLLTQTSQGSRLEVIIIDLAEPECMVRITSTESSGVVWSWSPLATDGHERALASRGAQTVPNELALGKLEEYGGKPRMAWQVIEMPSLIPHCEHISGFIWRILLILMAVLQ